MLRLIILIVDLVVMNAITMGSPNTFASIAALALAIKIKLNCVAHQSAPGVAQSQLLSSLIKPSPPPPDERCIVCQNDEFSLPHKLSCNHVFCRDCALITLAMRPTCPICSKIPVQQHEDTEGRQWVSNLEEWLWCVFGCLIWCMLWRKAPEMLGDTEGRLGSGWMITVTRALLNQTLAQATDDFLRSSDMAIRLSELDIHSYSHSIASLCTFLATMTFC